MSARPEIFISATSRDLRSSRQLVRDALLTIGCVPVTQDHFAPDARTVREMLRARIAACDAVIHLAGHCYGFEPRERDASEPHQSYTQMEYDMARELRKPVYVFLCADDFPYDAHDPEPPELRALQDAHRAALQSRDDLYQPVHDPQELALHVRELQTRVEHLSRRLHKARSWLGRGVTVALLALTLIAVLLVGLHQHSRRTEEEVTHVSNTLDRYLASTGRAPPGGAMVVPEKSIAVLPFDNLSDEKSNAYFAEGIQDEILTDLAKVADLKVISRTSVMAYVPGHAGSVREIGIALGVAHLLEGSVQRAANRVRVSAQLIDARTDAHLWADHFDRDLSDVFSIQSEMAERIVSSLSAKLSPVEKTAIGVRPTSDLAAYDLFLEARELVNTYQETPDWPATLHRAVRLLDEATVRDPGFALAYCQTARAHDQLYYQGLDPTPARLTLEEQATATALRLQPNLGEAHLARALYLYHGQRDYPGTHRELAIARAALPNNADVFSLETYLARREGRWPDALSNQQRAATLDPRNPAILVDQIITYDMLRFYRDELHTVDAAIGITPASTNYLYVLKAAALVSAGQPAAARAELDRLPADYDPNGSTTGVRVSVALAERHPDEAASRVAAFQGKEYPGINGLLTPREWLEAFVARAAGDPGRARAAFTQARKVVDASLRERPDEPGALALLGQIDAGLGNKEAALREGRRAVELRPVSADAMDGPGVASALAMICAWTGETDAALRQLETLEKTPGGPDYGQLRFDPAWDPLKGQARFEAMLARMDPHLGLK